VRQDNQRSIVCQVVKHSPWVRMNPPRMLDASSSHASAFQVLPAHFGAFHFARFVIPPVGRRRVRSAATRTIRFANRGMVCHGLPEGSNLPLTHRDRGVVTALWEKHGTVSLHRVILKLRKLGLSGGS
jgi:hypothetical protein